jgi:hypothetical protein
MKMLHALRMNGSLLGSAIVLMAAPAAQAMKTDGGITAVAAKVSDDYVRATLPDGSPESESYAFGKGGYYPAPISDNTIDDLTFVDIAHTLAGPLSSQNYVPAKDPAKTKLLIMVYWGETYGSMDVHYSAIDLGYRGFRGDHGGTGQTVFGDAETARIDAQNASILGYDEALNEFGWKARRERPDLLDDLERGRYFVVLMAYDFQTLWRQKKHKLLWETRFSIREQGNDFTQALPAMAQYSSEYFGKDSHGLLRTFVPDGRIHVGTPSLVEFMSGDAN